MEQLIFFGILIFFFSAILQGLTGFGFSILAVPLITLLISPKTAVPILLLYSIIINLAVLYNTRNSVSIKNIWPFLLTGVIAMPFGTYLLVALEEAILKILIGVIILIFGFLLLMGFRKQFTKEKLAMLPIGFLSGILGGSISVSGPPLIIFLSNQNVNKNTFRGNLALYFLILNIFTLPVYLLNGLLTSEVWSYSLKFSPGLLIGVVLGNLLSHKVRESHFQQITLYLLIILGTISIISSLS
ncbi:MAG: sulfite exporter TauE/SafE family protein [Candidatus Cloacimonetes bacterium]|nr:sulfite exporter TauE/SafE family protein [Candidatus Cloacimonadota bacterium]